MTGTCIKTWNLRAEQKHEVILTRQKTGTKRDGNYMNGIRTVLK